MSIMKRLSTLICLLVLTLAFASCEKNKTEKVQEIGYGTSFGMCAGYCLNNVVVVNTGEITFSKTANGINPSTKTCTKEITEAEVRTLKGLVKASDFNKLPEVIGCPDCADGGAEWVALKLEGKLKRVTFEYGNAPDEIKELVIKLREIKESFKDCN